MAGSVTSIISDVSNTRSTVNTLFKNFLNNNAVITQTLLDSICVSITSEIKKLESKTTGRALTFTVTTKKVNDYNPKAYELVIMPSNLFTLLVFNGYVVTAEALKGDEYTIPEVGTFYQYLNEDEEIVLVGVR